MELSAALQAFIKERMPHEPIERVALIHLFQDLLRLCGEHSTQESPEAVAHLHWCRIAAAMSFESYRETFLDAQGRPRFAEPSERQLLAEQWLRKMLAQETADTLSVDAAVFALVLLADCAVGARAFSGGGLKTFAYFNKADPDAGAYEMDNINRAFQMHAGILMHISKLTPLNGRMQDVVEAIETHMRVFWDLYNGIWSRIYVAAFFDDRRMSDSVAESLRAMSEICAEAGELIRRLNSGVGQMVMDTIHTMPKAMVDMYIALSVSSVKASDAVDGILAQENDRDLLVGRVCHAIMDLVGTIQSLLATVRNMDESRSWSVLTIFFAAHGFKADMCLGDFLDCQKNAFEFVDAVDEATQLIGPITDKPLWIPGESYAEFARNLPAREAARRWLRTPEVFLVTKKQVRQVTAHLLATIMVSVEGMGVLDTCMLLNSFLAERVSTHPLILRCKEKNRARKLAQRRAQEASESKLIDALANAHVDDLSRRLGVLDIKLVHT